MPDAVIAGHPMHWRVIGAGPRPVLMLHCSLAHGGALRDLALGLGDGVTCTVPDLPSHGQSGDWDGVSDLHALTTTIAGAMAEDIGGGAPVDIIGHSFGATVALRLALERPGLVRSLTLNEPVFFAAARAAAAPEFDAFMAGETGFVDLVRSGRLDEAAAGFHAAWGTGPALADLPPAQRDYITRRIGLIPVVNDVLLHDRVGMLRPGWMESLDMPVLLIEGALSPSIIAAVGAELARRLPRARRLVVPGAGHMVPITHTAEILPEVRAHLGL